MTLAKEELLREKALVAISGKESSSKVWSKVILDFIRCLNGRK
jgi:hypothetical protein|tara:strand:+ start:580 stop:708 length:129 start_codon:yes stop_codon:yes gene_type:complete